MLLGGGVESTALVRRFLAEGRTVVPVHVHCGMIWDDCETRYVLRFLESNAGSELAPLVEIRLPLEDFLRGHWTVTGVNVPRAGASSADLEIPLRNLTLLSFALHRLRQLRNGEAHSAASTAVASEYALALGTTADNCYRDGNRSYFDKCEEVLSLDAGCPVRVLTPFIGMNKTQVDLTGDSDARPLLALKFFVRQPGRRPALRSMHQMRPPPGRVQLPRGQVRDPTVYANTHQAIKSTKRSDSN